MVPPQSRLNDRKVFIGFLRCPQQDQILQCEAPQLKQFESVLGSFPTSPFRIEQQRENSIRLDVIRVLSQNGAYFLLALCQL